MHMYLHRVKLQWAYIQIIHISVVMMSFCNKVSSHRKCKKSEKYGISPFESPIIIIRNISLGVWLHVCTRVENAYNVSYCSSRPAIYMSVSVNLVSVRVSVYWLAMLL